MGLIITGIKQLKVNTVSGYSMNFKTDKHINIDGALIQLNSTTVGTWSFWVKFIDVTPTLLEGMISFSDTDANTRIQVDIGLTGIIRCFVVASGSVKSQVVAEKVNTGIVESVWFHIAIVQDEINLTLYVNAVKPIQTNLGTDQGFWFNNIPLLDNGRIGDLSYDNGEKNWFTGDIDDVSLWKKAFSQDEIDELYHLGVPTDLRQHSAVDDLVMWIGADDPRDNFNSDVAGEWRFYDQSGNGNNGNSVNMIESDRSLIVPSSAGSLTIATA